MLFPTSTLSPRVQTLMLVKSFALCAAPNKRGSRVRNAERKPAALAACPALPPLSHNRLVTFVSSCSKNSASPSVADMGRNRACGNASNGTRQATLHAGARCPCPALELITRVDTLIRDVCADDGKQVHLGVAPRHRLRGGAAAFSRSRELPDAQGASPENANWTAIGTTPR